MAISFRRKFERARRHGFELSACHLRVVHVASIGAIALQYLPPEELEHPVLVVVAQLFEKPGATKSSSCRGQLVRHALEHFLNFVPLPVMCPTDETGTPDLVSYPVKAT